MRCRYSKACCLLAPIVARSQRPRRPRSGGRTGSLPNACGIRRRAFARFRHPRCPCAGCARPSPRPFAPKEAGAQSRLRRKPRRRMSGRPRRSRPAARGAPNRMTKIHCTASRHSSGVRTGARQRRQRAGFAVNLDLHGRVVFHASSRRGLAGMSR